MAGLMAIAEAMSESQLDVAVRRLFNDLGLAPYTFHPYGQGKYRSGYPDWTIAGPGGVMWRELKRQKARPTAAQRAWIERLRATGCDVDVWRPMDLLTKRIANELIAISGIICATG